MSDFLPVPATDGAPRSAHDLPAPSGGGSSLQRATSAGVRVESALDQFDAYQATIALLVTECDQALRRARMRNDEAQARILTRAKVMLEAARRGVANYVGMARGAVAANRDVLLRMRAGGDIPTSQSALPILRASSPALIQDEVLGNLARVVAQMPVTVRTSRGGILREAVANVLSPVRGTVTGVETAVRRACAASWVAVEDQGPARARRGPAAPSTTEAMHLFATTGLPMSQTRTAPAVTPARAPVSTITPAPPSRAPGPTTTTRPSRP